MKIIPDFYTRELSEILPVFCVKFNIFLLHT